MSREEIFDAAREAILEYNVKEAEDVAKRGIKEGIEPMEPLKGIVAKRFDHFRLYKNSTPKS